MRSHLSKLFAAGIVFIAYVFMFAPALVLLCVFRLIGGLLNGAADGLEDSTSSGFVYRLVKASERHLWGKKRGSGDA